MKKYTSSKNTRRNIIEAAGSLAAEHGLDNVSTRAVAEASGENIGSIHYHFGGKDGLFEALVSEAVGWCKVRSYYDAVDSVSAQSSPEELAAVVRAIVHGEIADLFCSDRPIWHSQVIYQLLQREDELHELFRRDVLEPSTKAMERFFRMIVPEMTSDELFQRIIILKMPIYAHANYMKFFLSVLNADHYSKAYLQGFEDILVRQTQLLLGTAGRCNER